VSQETIDAFHKLAYSNLIHAKREPLWRGVPICKLPTDLWTYQEIIFETKPNVIIETGTWTGGSSIFFSEMMGAFSDGPVITIDVTHAAVTEEAARLMKLTDVYTLLGSSVSDAVLQQVQDLCEHWNILLKDQGELRTMVVLDSDHSKDHVLAELRAYAPLVTSGCYLVVEDGNINGHPVLPDYGPGPYEAVEAFLAETNGFVVDEARHQKHLVSLFPRGYLRKT
jgi:cephalosporin hydroxylase